MNRKKICILALVSILASMLGVYGQQPTSLVIPLSATMDGQTGDIQIIFRLYNQPSGGTPVFTETQTVPVSNGSFSVLIGNQTTDGVPPTVFSANKSTYIAFALASDPNTEIGARVPVASSGYAHVASGIIPGTRITGGVAAGTSLIAIDNLAGGSALTAASQGVLSLNGLNVNDAGTAVFGGAISLTGFTRGVLGQSFSPNGVGVVGSATFTEASGQPIGVSGEVQSPNGIGVFGTAPRSAIVGASSGGTGVEARTSSTTEYAMKAMAPSRDGMGLFVQGKLMVDGPRSSAVTLHDGKHVALYAVESPENWFEDVGHARLENGTAVVQLDDTFAQVVNASDVEYHVFLTPNGDCNGLYVAKRTPAFFEVSELNGGMSNISFSYRIIAKVRGLENVRLESLEIPAPTEILARPNLENIK